MENNITVIVPTYNCRESIVDLIKSLEVQSCQQFDVLIVNNDTQQRSAHFLADIISQSPLNISLIQAPENLGPAKGRNFAVPHTQSKILAFTDDDCVADSNWIEVIKESFEESEHKVFYGLVYSDVPPTPPFIHGFEMTGQAFGSGNCAIDRQFFMEIGMFDEFMNNWAEDFELGAKCERHGDAPIYVESMRINHPPKLTPYRYQNHFLSKFFLSKYYYLTETKGYVYKYNFLSESMRPGAKKLILFLFILLFPLPHSKLVNLIAAVSFLSLIGLKRVLIFLQKKKDYPFKEKISAFNLIKYATTSWIVDILNFGILIIYSLFKHSIYKVSKD